jgi:hypothetical protein
MRLLIGNWHRKKRHRLIFSVCRVHFRLDIALSLISGGSRRGAKHWKTKATKAKSTGNCPRRPKSEKKNKKKTAHKTYLSDTRSRCTHKQKATGTNLVCVYMLHKN